MMSSCDKVDCSGPKDIELIQSDGVIAGLASVQASDNEDDVDAEIVPLLKSSAMVDGSGNNGLNYATKKTIAQGMMDIALLTANASQLKYIMRSPYWDIYHQVNIALICISITLQILVGVILISIGRIDHMNLASSQRTYAMNDLVVILIFVITIVNIFVATFGVDDYEAVLRSPRYRPEL